MNRARQGVTLLELLIAVAIFLVVAGAIFASFRAGIRGFREIENNLKVSQSAGQALERIDADLRNAFVYSRDKESGFLGSASGMSFLTLSDTFTKDGISRDYAFVSYQFSENKLMRLLRRDQESLNHKSEIKPEEMPVDIEKIQFSYGYADADNQALSFQDSWGSGGAPDEQKTLPRAVRIIIGIKGKAAQEFERTIYLPVKG